MWDRSMSSGRGAVCEFDASQSAGGSPTIRMEVRRPQEESEE